MEWNLELFWGSYEVCLKTCGFVCFNRRFFFFLKLLLTYWQMQNDDAVSCWVQPVDNDSNHTQRRAHRHVVTTHALQPTDVTIRLFFSWSRFKHSIFTEFSVTLQTITVSFHSQITQDRLCWNRIIFSVRKSWVAACQFDSFYGRQNPVVLWKLPATLWW